MTTTETPPTNNTPIPRQHPPKAGDPAARNLKQITAQQAADEPPEDQLYYKGKMGTIPDNLGQMSQPPGAPAPATKPSRPTTLAEAAPWLLKPFRQQDVELKPTATTKDKTRALASPYVDM